MAGGARAISRCWEFEGCRRCGCMGATEPTLGGWLVSWGVVASPLFLLDLPPPAAAGSAGEATAGGGGARPSRR